MKILRGRLVKRGQMGALRLTSYHFLHTTGLDLAQVTEPIFYLVYMHLTALMQMQHKKDWAQSASEVAAFIRY